MDLTIDADRPTLLVDHRKNDSVVQDNEFFAFHAKLGEGAEPLVQEAANCRSAFIEAPRRPPVEDRIGSEEGHHRVDVTPIHSLEGEARALNQIGRRGLGHDPVSITRLPLRLKPITGDYRGGLRNSPLPPSDAYDGQEWLIVDDAPPEASTAAPVRRRAQGAPDVRYCAWRATALASMMLLGVPPMADGAARGDRAKRLVITGLAGSLQNPCWSPTGDRLAITQWTRGYNKGPAVVRVVSAQRGSPIATLGPTDSDAVNLPGSCWDRGTDRVVYTSDAETDRDQVFVAPASGGEPVRVTNPPEVAFEPSFSPDGQWIVYESHRASDRRGEIWKVNLAGTVYQRLTTGGDDRQPNWAPFGDRILFQRSGRGGADIWTMNTDGGDLRNVTRTGDREETDASFSPSGRFIVYSGDGPRIDLASIFTIPTGGGRRIQVTRTRGIYDGAPAWSSTGRIAFESSRGDPERGRTTLWTIRAPRGRQ